MIKKTKSVNKTFYSRFLEKKAEIPFNDQNKWNIDLNKEISIEEWNKYYKQNFKLIEDTKLKNLQFTIFHRILFTNSKLFKCGLSETELCSFCNNTRETIFHIFFECMFSKNILLSFVSLLEAKCDITFELSPENVILGPQSSSPEEEIIYICILIYKKYINSCRLKKCLPSFEVFVQMLKRYKNLDIYSLYMYPIIKANYISSRWNIITRFFE